MSTKIEKPVSSKVVSVRVPDELRAQLDYLSHATNRSRAYLASEALGDYVKKNAWRAKELRDAIAEADRGVFISHEAMLAWADKRRAGKKVALPKPEVRAHSRRV